MIGKSAGKPAEEEPPMSEINETIDRYWPYVEVVRFVGISLIAGCVAGATVGVAREIREPAKRAHF